MIDNKSPLTVYKNRQRGFLWLIQLILCSCIVIWLINPVSENIYLLLIFTVAWVAVTTLMYGSLYIRAFLNVKTLPIFIWPVVLLLYSIVDHASFSLSYIMYLFVFQIGLFYVRVEDNKTAKWITFIVLLYLTIISINTLIVYQIRPTISRVLAYGDAERIAYYGGTQYMTPFVAGYDIIYGMVFMVSVMLFTQSKQRNVKRIISIMLVILYAVLVLKAQYFIAILLAIFGVSFVYMEQTKKVESRYLIISLLTLCGIVTMLFGAPLLNYLSELPNMGYNISVKLKDIAQILSGETEGINGSVGGRAYYYGISISNFFDHLFFGAGAIGDLYLNSGNHSTILDAFAQYGMIGGIPYLAYYFLPLKQITNKLNMSEKRVWKVVLCLFVVLALINRATTRANYALLYIVIPMILALCVEDSPERPK